MCTQIKKHAVIHLAVTICVGGLSHPIFGIDTPSLPLLELRVGLYENGISLPSSFLLVITLVIFLLLI